MARENLSIYREMLQVSTDSFNRFYSLIEIDCCQKQFLTTVNHRNFSVYNLVKKYVPAEYSYTDHIITFLIL